MKSSYRINYNQEISLEKGQYVGVDLLRIKDLSTFNIDYENGEGLTLQVSKMVLNGQQLLIKMVSFQMEDM